MCRLSFFSASREEYGDNAVGYVEVKREGPLCTVQCRICPEHRVRAKNYLVCLTLNEVEEDIVNVECKDCAAAAGRQFIMVKFIKIKYDLSPTGGCKHALAFLMWLRRRNRRTCTKDVLLQPGTKHHLFCCPYIFLSYKHAEVSTTTNNPKTIHTNNVFFLTKTVLKSDNFLKGRYTLNS